MTVFYEDFPSAAAQHVQRTIERIAPSDLGVLIVGEPGSGKSWTASCIHRMSSRAAAPCHTFDCASMPAAAVEEALFGTEHLSRYGISETKGVLEMCRNGTVILDDFGGLPHASQQKIARSIERKSIRRIGGRRDLPVDVRFIGTLNRSRNLPPGELPGRIAPLIINLPPLRERKDDIPLFVAHFLAESEGLRGGRASRMNEEALSACASYAWPGNIRELKDALDYAAGVTPAGTIGPEHLPAAVSRIDLTRSPRSIASVERAMIEHALLESRTKREAAAVLGISLKTLYNKLSRYELSWKFVNTAHSRGADEGRTSARDRGTPSAALSAGPAGEKGETP